MTVPGLCPGGEETLVMSIDPEGGPLNGAACAFSRRSGDVLCAALLYATQLGFRIVPVMLEPFFRPLMPNWPETASSDPDVIRDWWRRWPDAAAAVATGAGSGVLVIDQDVKNGVDGCATLRAIKEKYGAIAATWVASTPSGGRHEYLKHPGPRHFISNQVHRELGIDIRADGGLVVLPPSKRSGGAYSWIRPPFDSPPADPPYWLGALAQGRAVAPTPARPVLFTSKAALAKYVANAVTSECERVASTPAGGRNDALYLAACRLGEFVAGGYLPEDVAWHMLQAAGDQCGLAPREIYATTKSGLNDGARQARRLEVSR